MDLASLLESMRPDGAHVDAEHARWVAQRDALASMPRGKRYAGHQGRIEAYDEQGAKDFQALLARLRPMFAPGLGPKPGSLEAILNARRMQNPRPSPTPPPIIGMRG